MLSVRTQWKVGGLVILALLFVLIYFFASNISDPTQNSIDRNHLVSSNVSYYLDSDNTQSLEQIIEISNYFIKGNLNDIPWGFEQQTYWINIVLNSNTTENLDLFAHFDNPMLDNLQIFQLNKQQEIVKQKLLGDTIKNIAIKNKSILFFEFNLPANETTNLLIKIKTTGIAKTPIKIYERHDFLKLSKNIYLIWGVFVGVIVLIALYNLVLFFGLNDKIYLIYICYLLFVLFLMGVVLGFGHLLWPEYVQQIFQAQVVSINYFVAVFTLLFTLFFLQYNKVNDIYYRVGKYAVYLLVFLGTISLWIPEYIAARIFFAVLFFYYILSFILIGKKLRTNFHWAKFYIISWLPLLTGAAVQPMMLTGVIEYSFLARHAFMIGVLCEVTLMAMALAERMRYQKEKTLFNATHDPELKLPNYNYLEAKIQRLINENKYFSVCLIEITSFSTISPYISHNDSLKLVSNVVDDISNAIREKDIFLCVKRKTNIKIAKAKDGVLAVLIDKVVNNESLLTQIEELQKSISLDINLSGFYINLQTKIGVSCADDNNRTPVNILVKAFQALEQSKRECADISIYKDTEAYNLAQRLTLATELQQAIRNDDLKLYHQPQIDLMNNKIHGSELLLRWYHPKHGFIPPDIFIPIAEDTDVINELTMWVLDTACQHLNVLLEQGHTEHKVSINISGKDIAIKDFLSKVKDTISNYDTPTTLLNFELTESVMVNDYQQLSKLMDDLSYIGIGLSVDDYGTGYSSLAYISQLPFNELKIDKSFVFDLEHSVRNLTIVKATIDMAASLGLKVVAEGIESSSIEQKLLECQCNIAQGYYYSKPLPFDDYLNWLDNYSKRVK